MKIRFKTLKKSSYNEKEKKDLHKGEGKINNKRRLGCSRGFFARIIYFIFCKECGYLGWASPLGSWTNLSLRPKQAQIVPTLKMPKSPHLTERAQTWPRKPTDTEKCERKAWEWARRTLEMPLSPALAYGCRYARPLKHLFTSTLSHTHRRSRSLFAQSALKSNLSLSLLFPHSSFLTGNSLLSTMQVSSLSLFLALRSISIMPLIALNQLRPYAWPCPLEIVYDSR